MGVYHKIISRNLKEVGAKLLFFFFALRQWLRHLQTESFSRFARKAAHKLH